MNVVILGSGEEEREWAHWLLEQDDVRVDAAFPGFSDAGLEAIPRVGDLDGLLARPGVDIVIAGGPIEQRGESLRRCAAEGMAIICLHPPGADSEPYYQVALSRAETGAVIVPNLPLRLHPGVAALRLALQSGELGAFRGVRLEAVSEDAGVDLARVVFPRLVDVIRALLGEIEGLSATGDPPGDEPDLELIVQLRAAEKRRAELRIRSGHEATNRLTLSGAAATWTLEFDSLLEEQAVLVRQIGFRAARSPDARAVGPARGDLLVIARGVWKAQRGGRKRPQPARCDASDGTGGSHRPESAQGPDGRPPL